MEYDLTRFEQEFSKRTQEIIKNYSGSLDATLLLNCMVGLLIVPRERRFGFLADMKIPYAFEEWGINSEAVICTKRGGGNTVTDKSISWLVVKLRNAVAHFNVLPTHDSGVVSGFEFWDRSGFRARFTCDELATFAVNIAKHIEENSSGYVKQKSEPKWTRRARLYYRAPTERIYVIDCPDDMQRQCYEISSTAREYYIFGSIDNIPKYGATDCCIEADAQKRNMKVCDLVRNLVHELPSDKRLSVYTNDQEVVEQIKNTVVESERTRLAHFAIYPILPNRQKSAPKPTL